MVKSGAPSSTNGPNIDHTLGTSQGYYINIESVRANVGDRAELISEPMVDSRDGCILFWYYRRGFQVGPLNVYLKSDGERSELLWTQRSGDYSTSWKQGIAPFQSNTSHQIVLEGVVGYSTEDLAFDDVLIRRESCQIQPANARPQNQVLDLVSCNFEDGNLCKWQNAPEFGVVWSVAVNETDPFHESGPQGGAAGTKYFAVVSARQCKNKDIPFNFSSLILLRIFKC